MSTYFLNIIRSFSFGGLLGALLAGIVYLQFPYFQQFGGLQGAMIFGGLVGAACQRGVAAVVNTIIFPIGRFISYYEKLIELDILLYFARITHDDYRTLNSKLTEQRFLGTTSDTKQLPPKT